MDQNQYEQVISVLKSEHQNEKQALLNSIASALKAEFNDFHSVDGEPMTADLGENMRIQIESIFKTLKKYGIDPSIR